jgi:hypothetical protein
MGVDRTGAGTDKPAEPVEEPPPAERRPPPDRPGAEGAPSRADSRNGAAAANETSTQAAEKQGEKKPDVAQPSQETSERKNTTAEIEPEALGTPESDRGVSEDDSNNGERYGTGHTQADTTGRPEAEQPSEEIGDLKGGNRGEQAPDGQAAPRDGTASAETGEPSAPSTAVDQTEDVERTPEPHGASSESRGVPHDGVTDEARADAKPVEHAFERTAPTQSTEGQPKTTDKAQPDADIPQANDGPPAAEPDEDNLARPAHLTRDHRDATIEAEEPAGYISDAPVEGQSAGQGLDAPDNDVEPTGEGMADEERSAGQGERPDGHRTFDGKQVSAHLDPLGGADAGSDVIGKPWTDPADDLPPTGEELVKMEDDAKPRPEKVRKKFFEVVSDAHDITGKAANKGHDIFAHPPTGHAETSTAPEVIPAPQQGVDAGDLATGLLVLGTLFGEGIRRRREKLKEKKGSYDGGNR